MTAAIKDFPLPIPPVIPIVIDPIIVEVIPDEVEVPIVITTPGQEIPPEIKPEEKKEPSYPGGGDGGSGGPGDPRPPKEDFCYDPVGAKVQFNTTSATFTTHSKYKKLLDECKCKTQGVLTVKGTVTSTYCKNRNEKMSISVYGYAKGRKCGKSGSADITVTAQGTGKSASSSMGGLGDKLSSGATTNWTANISMCEPSRKSKTKNCDNPDYLLVSPSQGYGSPTVWGNDEDCECKCPKTKDELKKECGDLLQDIKYYDCETDYKAETSTEAIAHNQTVEGRNPKGVVNTPPWLKNCQECLKCDDPQTVGTLSIIRADYKTCKPCGEEKDKSKCGGGVRLDTSVRSKGFDSRCLKAFDLYAEVSVIFDNWGYIKDANGNKISYKCSNDGSDSCDICVISQQIGPLENTVAGTDNLPAKSDDENLSFREAGLAAWSINSPHGGPTSVSGTVRFFWKKKPEN